MKVALTALIRRFANRAYRKVVTWLLSRNSILSRLYFIYLDRPGYPSIQYLLEAYSRSRPNDVFFIQIGANDGYSKDPICRFIKRDKWKGIVVEPQYEVFKHQLQPICCNDTNVILENVAIAPESREMELYKIAFSSARWATGLASFVKNCLEKHIDNGHVARCAIKEGVALPHKREDYITVEKVTCLSFSDLLAKHQVAKVNVLQIDTEGFDFEIIKLIDFKRITPDIILFENEHLSPDDYQACLMLLKAQGYEIFQAGRDTIAFVRSQMPALDWSGFALITQVAT